MFRQGTEAEAYVKNSMKATKGRKAADSPAKKSDWRRKHEEFIEAIRSAKQMQQHLANGGKLSDLPPPPPSENPDYVQCPHCKRRFNQSAAERHIPKCSSFQFNKPKANVKTSTIVKKRHWIRVSWKKSAFCSLHFTNSINPINYVYFNRGTNVPYDH